MRITQGVFRPARSPDSRYRRRFNIVSARLAVEHRINRRSASRNTFWAMWGLTSFRHARMPTAADGNQRIAASLGNSYIRMSAFELSPAGSRCSFLHVTTARRRAGCRLRTARGEGRNSLPKILRGRTSPRTLRSVANGVSEGSVPVAPGQQAGEISPSGQVSTCAAGQEVGDRRRIDQLDRE